VDLKPRVVVVGGGITGAFCAYFLARLGAEVTLVERDAIASQASGHNAGGLNPLHGPGIPGAMEGLALESMGLHLEHWDEICELSGSDFAGRVVRRMYVAMDEEETRTLAEREVFYNSTPGFSASWLAPDELVEFESRLRDDVLGALYTEGNASVDPAPYTKAVAAAAVRLGARTVAADARDLRHRSGRVTEVLLDSGSLECDAVAIACGAWCELPARWLGVKLPVEPLKGELLHAEIAADAPVVDITWRDVGVYGAGNHRVWLGGTEEHAGFDAAVSPSARARILEGVQRLLPGIGPIAILDHVAGLRPVTPDGLPIVGIPSGWQNACVALGAGRKGMLLGAGLGLAAAELLTGGHTHVPVEAFAPDRLEPVA
jgi:glycine/D-amino acid oxidase-like deaminating enzyme